MAERRDLFISHAHADKERYILPLTQALSARDISYWLDNAEIGWGENFVLKINEGLRTSRYVLVCLSNNFLGRHWTESELSAVLATQKRVLPLILNEKERLLETYPLLASLAYREYGSDLQTIIEELANLLQKERKNLGQIRVVIEGKHTGITHEFNISPKSSVRWLEKQAQLSMNVKEEVDIGTIEPFRIRWVLVDSRAEKEWKKLNRSEQVLVHAMIKAGEDIKISYNDEDHLEDIGVYDGIVFHLYGTEDIRFPIYDYPAPAPPRRH